MPRPPKSKDFEAAMRSMTKGRKRQNDVKLWDNRQNLSETVYKNFYDEIARNTDFYRGHQYGFSTTGADSDFNTLAAYARSGKLLITNKIMSALAAQNSAIMWRRPWHFLRARRTAGLNDEEARWTAEHALNACLGDPRNNWLLKARLMLLGSEIGVGVMKATYTMHEGIDPEKGREERYGTVAMIEDPTTGETTPIFQGGIPRRDKDGKPIRRGRDKFLVDDRRLSDYYRTDYIHPFKMRFDPEGSNDLQDHGWVLELVQYTYDEFMAVPFFEGKEDAIRAARVLTPESLSTRTKRFFMSGAKGTPFNPTPGDKDLLRFYGRVCWDFQKREITYLLDGWPKALAKIKYPAYIDTSPYVVSKFHEDPDEFIPITEVAQARPMASAYNELNSMLLTHAKRFTRRYLAKEGMFNEREMEKLKSNDDGNILQYRRNYTKTDFDPVKDANLDPAIYRNLMIYERDMNQLVGSSGMSQATPEASETATESSIVESRVQNRDTDKRALVAKPLERHAGIVLSMMQHTLPEGILIQEVGPLAVPFQKNVSRHQMSGDFEVFIELSELEPHDARSERSDMNEILQLIGPMAFMSPTFSKRFWEARRRFDPQIVQEMRQIGQMALQMQMGPQEQGGAKPSKGSDKGAEGRSAGRQAREEKK